MYISLVVPSLLFVAASFRFLRLIRFSLSFLFLLTLHIRYFDVVVFRCRTIFLPFFFFHSRIKYCTFVVRLKLCLVPDCVRVHAIRSHKRTTQTRTRIPCQIYWRFVTFPVSRITERIHPINASHLDERMAFKHEYDLLAATVCLIRAATFWTVEITLEIRQHFEK